MARNNFSTTSLLLEEERWLIASGCLHLSPVKYILPIGQAVLQTGRLVGKGSSPAMIELVHGLPKFQQENVANLFVSFLGTREAQSTGLLWAYVSRTRSALLNQFHIGRDLPIVQRAPTAWNI